MTTSTISTENINILIVDDDKEIIDLVNDYLSQKGFKVSTAMDGEIALELFKENIYHIAIIDLYIPEINGTDLLKEIKRIRPETGIIMITGFGTIKDAVECMKLGAADFITKPIMLDHLYMTINRILEEARLKEEAELASYYKSLSHLDELTGLYNFRHLVSSLKKEAERHLRYNHPLSIAMIDIDNFKDYNDSQGHEEGNELLIRLAHTFRHNTRNCDIITRYGGEEFVIIFPETPLTEAVVVTRRILKTVESSLEISVTIGLASLPNDSRDYKELIRLADKAMYWGKKRGKNQLVLYEDTTST